MGESTRRHASVASSLLARSKEGSADEIEEKSVLWGIGIGLTRFGYGIYTLYIGNFFVGYSLEQIVGMFSSTRFTCLLGVFCLLGTSGISWGSEEVDSSLERWIRELGHPVWHQRKQAEERIAQLGDSVLSQLVESLPGSSYSVKVGILHCLGRIPDLSVNDVLVEYLDDPVPEVARAAAVALTGRDPESTWWGVEGVSNRTFHHKTGPEFSRRMIRTLRAKVVEGALLKESSELGGVIYYNGQFSRLSRFGKEISQVLIEIVRQAEEYPFEGVESPTRQNQLLTLARQALLDQVDSVYLKDYQELARNGSQDIKRMAQVALYRLGQPNALQRQIQMLEFSVQRGSRSGASGNLGQLCNIYYAVERYEDAVRCYRSSIALGEENAVDHYNLACSLSRLNRIEEALTALEAAFAKGYSSRKSLMRDGDLAVLRGEARFQALLGK